MGLVVVAVVAGGARGDMAAAPKRRVAPLVHCAAGIIAGCSSTTVLYPLDLVKVRFQAATSARLPGVVQTMLGVGRDEGYRALFSGLTPALLGSAMSWGGFFYFYEHLKARESSQSAAASAWSTGVSSIQAGALTVLLTNPVWLVKTRLQLQKGGTSAYAAPGSLREPYRGIAHAFRSIVAEEGWRALYRGLLPSLLLTSHGAVQFVCYEQLKRLRPPSGKAQHEALVYGALSKLAASLATYPYQVVKTRVQRRNATSGKYAADLAGGELARTLVCVRDTATQEGLRGFFKGCWPNSLRVMPSAAITFWVYELAVNAASLSRGSSD